MPYLGRYIDCFDGAAFSKAINLALKGAAAPLTIDAWAMPADAHDRGHKPSPAKAGPPPPSPAAGTTIDNSTATTLASPATAAPTSGNAASTTTTPTHQPRGQSTLNFGKKLEPSSVWEKQIMTALEVNNSLPVVASFDVPLVSASAASLRDSVMASADEPTAAPATTTTAAPTQTVSLAGRLYPFPLLQTLTDSYLSLDGPADFVGIDTGGVYVTDFDGGVVSRAVDAISAGCKFVLAIAPDSVHTSVCGEMQTLIFDASKLSSATMAQALTTPLVVVVPGRPARDIAALRALNATTTIRLQIGRAPPPPPTAEEQALADATGAAADKRRKIEAINKLMKQRTAPPNWLTKEECQLLEVDFIAKLAHINKFLQSRGSFIISPDHENDYSMVKCTRCGKVLSAAAARNENRLWHKNYKDHMNSQRCQSCTLPNSVAVLQRLAEVAACQLSVPATTDQV